MNFICFPLHLSHSLIHLLLFRLNNSIYCISFRLSHSSSLLLFHLCVCVCIHFDWNLILIFRITNITEMKKKNSKSKRKFRNWGNEWEWKRKINFQFNWWCWWCLIMYEKNWMGKKEESVRDNFMNKMVVWKCRQCHCRLNLFLLLRSISFNFLWNSKR